MGRKTQYRSKADFDDLANATCSFCGHECNFAGIYHGYETFTLCAQCLVHHDLHELGILIGDAIVDYYENRFWFSQWKYPPELVDSVLKRIESATYRAISIGLYRRMFEQEKRAREHDESDLL